MYILNFILYLFFRFADQTYYFEAVAAGAPCWAVVQVDRALPAGPPPPCPYGEL